MVPSKAKWSLLSLARNKPYWPTVLSGVLLGLSFPPSPFWFLSFFAFVPIMLVVDNVPERTFEDKILAPFKAMFIIPWRILTFQFLWRKGVKTLRYNRRLITRHSQIFRYTYLSFLIWSFIGSHWWMLSSLEEESVPEFLQTLSAGVLMVVLTPFLVSLPFQIWSRMRLVFTKRLAMFFWIFAWLAYEYFNFHWELSWSWLTVGNSLTFAPYMLQYIEYTGILGASFFILFANYLVYLIFKSLGESSRMAWVYAISAVIWIAMPLFFNSQILNPERAVFQPNGTLNVRILQTNTTNRHQTTMMTRDQQMVMLKNLMLSQAIDSIDVFVFPEKAIHKPIKRTGLRGERILQPLWELIGRENFSVIAGFTEKRIWKEEDAPETAIRVRGGSFIDQCNSAAVLKKTGLMQTHIKGKLLPFEERLPFLNVLGFLRNNDIDLAGEFRNYGLPDTTFPLDLHNGAKVGILIGYESSFGSRARKVIGNDAEFLSILSNHETFGITAGNVQLSQMAIVRAIETRREVVRASETGPSMFVDVRGNIQQSSELNEQEVLDRKIHLFCGETLFLKYGNWPGMLALGITLLLGLITIIALGLKPKVKTGNK